MAPGAPLQVTLAFTDAPTGLPAGTPTPVNDLDLEVVDPAGGVHVGNNFNTRTDPTAAEHEVPAGSATPDSRNPVEKVRVATPAAGEWTIRVRASRVLMGPQGFALAATGLVSATPGGFTPGAPPQVDAPGAPAISGVKVTPLSGDAARVTFSTNEPTTAQVMSPVNGTPTAHVDSYNLGPDGYPGIPNDPVETSPQYADRPVVSTTHEITVTGLEPGASTLQLQAKDLGGTTTTQATTVTTNAAVVGAIPEDIGQLTAADTDALPPELGLGTGFGTATQMYAGQSGGAGWLGAFKFRVPASVDPTKIRGAAVELTSMHDFTNHYHDDTQVYVDLLPDALEPTFSQQNYGTIHGAPAEAHLQGDVGDRSGAYRTYSFAFGCQQLDKLRANLGGVSGGHREAAFRYDAVTTAAESMFSMETGFNRRSKGLQTRPRLVLFLDDGHGGAVDPLPCDPTLPAPTITQVGVTPVSAGVTSVSWRTDVPSDSTVLFRPKGSGGGWTQVANPARATVHTVSVRVPDATAAYEFAVRSATCGGAVTTDDRLGTGYSFAPDQPPPSVPAPSVHEFFDGDAPTATFGATSPAGDATDETQDALFVGSDSDPTSSGVARWSGNFSGELRRIDFDWWWSSATAGNPLSVPQVSVTVFTKAPASADWTPLGGEVVDNAVGPDSAPAHSSGGFPVVGTSQGQLLIQVSSQDPTLQTQTVHYGSTARPSSFTVTGVAPPGPQKPTAIPFPPLPAGSSGVNAAAVATRTVPTAADIAAGTARCAVLDETPTGGDPGTGGGGTGGGGGGGGGGGSSPGPSPARGAGYRMVAADGGIFTFGDRRFHGSTGDLVLNKPIVGGATDTSDDDGYWIVASDGGVFTFNAAFYGSLGGTKLASPAVEIEPTPTGRGYWIVLADGKVFTFGDADFFGDMSGKPLNKPIIGMSVTPSGKGYWLVAQDGGIFNFGDAGFFGSTGDKKLNAPIIDLAPSTDNAGYYLLGRDGGVFTFGSADFKGSTGSMTLNAPVIAMLVTKGGSGYWLAASDGGVFTFGNAGFLGSMGATKLNSPVLDLIE